MTGPSAEGPSWVARPKGFDLPILLQDLPPEVPFGFLGRLMPTSEPLSLHLELHPMPRERALQLIEGAGTSAEAELAAGRRSNEARRSDLELESESAEALGRRIALGEQELYKAGIAFHANGPSRSAVERARDGLGRRLSGLGFRWVVPWYEADAATAPPEPGRSVPRPRAFWHTLPSDGIGAFFPFIDETVAEPGGVLVGLLLDDAAPVLLDRWGQSSYSWGIFGTTGSGKSFSAALLSLRSRWMTPMMELFLIDPLGEFSPLVTALGGQVVRAAEVGAARVNPLEPGARPEDRPEKAARFSAVLRALFPSLSDLESAAIDGALARLYGSGTGAPTLSDLIEEVRRTPSPPERLLALLEVFRSGSLRHLDGPTTLVWERGPISFDLSGVDEAHRAFHLAYLLDAVYGRLQSTDRPKLVVVDEAHLLASDPATSELLDRLVRHVRHFRAGLLIASQNPDDFLTKATGRSLLRNLRASLLLRLPEVSEEARRFFDLTEAEAEWLPRARLPKEAGYSEGLLRLGPSHLPIAVIASTPEYELLTGTKVP